MREETPWNPITNAQALEKDLSRRIHDKTGMQLARAHRHRLNQVVTEIVRKRLDRERVFRSRFVLPEDQRRGRIGLLRSFGKIRRHTKKRVVLLAKNTGYTIHVTNDEILMRVPSRDNDAWATVGPDRPPGFIPLYQMNTGSGTYVQVAGVWLAEQRALRAGHILVTNGKKRDVYMSNELL